MMIAYLHGQAAHPVKVFGRQVAGIIHAVALKRLFAAVAPPRHEIAIRTLSVRGAKKHFLVVATKADEVAILCSTLNQQIEDILTLGTTVNVIAEKNETCALVAATSIARSQKGFQLFEAAVDVTNRECKAVRHQRLSRGSQWEDWSLHRSARSLSVTVNSTE
jgi:hypothetical protein